MSNAKPMELDPVVRRFVEEAGHVTQSLGFGRVMGQVYALLYFSAEPRNLEEIQAVLAISKGSASMSVRQLEQWRAVRKVWVKGDRKGYYEANDWFGEIVKNAAVDLVGKKMNSYSSLLDQVERQLQAENGRGNGEHKHVHERIRHLRKFQKRAEGLWGSAIVQRLLK